MQLVLAEGDEEGEELDVNKVNNNNTKVSKQMQIQPQPLKWS